MNTLKHYSSYLSVRNKFKSTEKRIRPKHSFASFLTADRSATASHSSSSGASFSNLSPADTSTSSNNGSTTAFDTYPEDEATSEQPAYSPPHSTSDYRWRFQADSKVWWRNVDSMANFILHWQTRFYQHGDMFFSCTLNVAPSSSSGDRAVACELSKAELREAVRRLRYDHPTVALRLAKRGLLGIEQLQNIPPLIAQHVDLQIALVYDLVESESDVEAWLDEVIIYHDSEERFENGAAFRSFIAAATADGVPGRDRLRVHYWPASATQDARVAIEQSHSVSEGIGTLYVFDLLLSSIASVLASPHPRTCAWGSEVTRLEPAVQDAIANPPEDWTVSPVERRQVEKQNADRMNGKATPPTLVDKVGGKVIAMTLKGENSSSSVRRKVVNKPLVDMCRSVAGKGDMFPLGLLPQTGRPFEGAITHTDLISDTLNPDQTRALLKVLKRKGITMAPFMEACANMATMWVRKHRGLAPSGRKFGGWDDPSRILGSFSNAISKRNTLQPQYAQYLGLCMSGFPTKIAAASATWSAHAESNTTASPTDPLDPLPCITPPELDRLFGIASDLAAQYTAARHNPNWLRYDQALMFNTMTTEYLFLRDSANYPSMPWLSSIGRVESSFRDSHPLPAPAEQGASLQIHDLNLVGRVAIRQPILHIYTFRMHTSIQLSFADWLYNPSDSDARKSFHNSKDDAQESRQNILHFWLQVFRSLVDAVLLQEADC
ncbi:hypothetical protein EX895_003115 [Sporisorium graminicola]|uniref:Uncharacterized protein n=1 Tax=Sporisorium graminicola TaxID=280036 RepID=A0A4V6ETU8_9BASI|nr:hypothetical protein EX895_003115 [Sporisorium graminicola]TKY88019.1 hypothetical protein EX895_003115 [Sporisorium graminicola]